MPINFNKASDKLRTTKREPYTDTDWIKKAKEKDPNWRKQEKARVRRRQAKKEGPIDPWRNM
jgi:hypothetical protein